eukprot:gene13681-9253_t
MAKSRADAEARSLRASSLEVMSAAFVAAAAASAGASEKQRERAAERRRREREAKATAKSAADAAEAERKGIELTELARRRARAAGTGCEKEQAAAFVDRRRANTDRMRQQDQKHNPGGRRNRGACTLENEPENAVCAACGTPRGGGPRRGGREGG